MSPPSRASLHKSHILTTGNIAGKKSKTFPPCSLQGLLFNFPTRTSLQHQWCRRSSLMKSISHRLMPAAARIRCLSLPVLATLLRDDNRNSASPLRCQNPTEPRCIKPHQARRSLSGALSAFRNELLTVPKRVLRPLHHTPGKPYGILLVFFSSLFVFFSRHIHPRFMCFCTPPSQVLSSLERQCGKCRVVSW